MKSARFEPAAALALAAVLVALGAAYGSTAKKADDPRASTFLDGRRGLHALFLVLAEIGAKPRRATSAPSAADRTDRTLVLAQPSEPVTKRETAALASWVASGGRLVIVGGPPVLGAFTPYTKPVLDAFGLSHRAIARPSGGGAVVLDEALAAGLGRIDWPAQWAVAVRAPAQGGGKFEELVTGDGGCLAGRLPFGEAGGEVVVVADANLLDNEALAKSDNAVLAARLLAGRATVDFDEFHHGFREGGDTGRLVAVLASMLVDTWPGRAVLVLALAGAVFLAGAAVRLGAPERERRPPRRALAEHAEALGRIFERAGARREALGILAAGARRVTGPRAGIPAALAPGEFVRRLAASPAPGAADLAAAIGRADAPRATKDVHMAEVAANLAEAKRRFLHAG